MRDTKTCPKCRHRDILFLPRITDFQGSALAAFVSDEDWESAGTLKILGQLEAYVCRACGFTEMFTNAPQDIPVDDIPGAKIFERDESPYR